jgi:hypothetical protein
MRVKKIIQELYYSSTNPIIKCYVSFNTIKRIDILISTLMYCQKYPTSSNYPNFFFFFLN